VDSRGPRCDNSCMCELVELGISLVAKHPAVTKVALAGSRSRGTHEELSDWDFAVETSHFGSVARDLPSLVEPLAPLAAQWEPLGHFPVYMVLLRGPTKFEYLFLDHTQEPRPPVTPSPETLPAIDAHFWDWLWWLATKASVGRDDLVEQHLPPLYRHLLEPLGADSPPDTIEAAARVFLVRRGALERRYGIHVSRALEREVRQGIQRLGYDV
jgi:predicted nucleotidyltransferase